MALQINCDETKPYIFVSYAHRDSDRVYSILSRLSDTGFNIWFDKGIEAGTTWDDNIALHIDKSAYFLAFISENYLNSGNCKDEISYARDLNKDMLLIYLDEIALPSGMAMRLNRSQAIIWNESDDIYSGEDFSKILNAKGINKTLINPNMAMQNSFLSDNAFPPGTIPVAAPTTVSEAIPPVSQVNRSADIQNLSTEYAALFEQASQNMAVWNLRKKKTKKIIIISAIAVAVVGLFLGLFYLFEKALNDYKAQKGFDDLEDFMNVAEDYQAEYEGALEAKLTDFGYWIENNEEDKESYVNYWAQIENPNKDVFIKNVTLKFTVRGEDDTIITTSEDYYSDILAGDTISVVGKVNLIYTDGDEEKPEVTCEVLKTEFGSKEASVKTVYSDIEFFNISTRPSEFGELAITGEVNFDTKSDDEFLNVIIIFNEDDECVYTETTYLSDIKPGKTQAFTIDLYSDIPEDYDEVILLPEKGW